MRLFLAIEPPAVVRLELTKLSDICQSYWTDELSRYGITGREVPPVSWVRPEKLHVTLKFFGEVPDSQLPELCEVLKHVTADETIRLVPERVTCLPPHGPIRVISVGLAGELERAHQLHRQIERRCEPIGFRPEHRGYRPHITLARLKGSVHPSMRERLERVGGKYLPALEFNASEFVLMQSLLHQSGAQYVPLARFPLQSTGS